MLHFFRKIRHNLIANSKTYKYLKYAIGEIVLVVLGILIALYINNQNELRKEQEKFDEVLVEVENELIWNVKNTLMGIQGSLEKDSLCSIIVFDGLNRDQLENDSLFQFRYYLDSYHYTVEDKAFKKLMDISNGLNRKQDSIGQMLSNLYNKDSIAYSKIINNRSLELTDKDKNSLKKHDWYIDYVLQKPYSQKEIDYYLNHPEYKKNAAEYLSIELSTNFFGLQVWFQKFLKSYNTLYTYLDNQKIQHNDSLFFTYNPNDYKHFIGKYKIVDWSYEINYLETNDIVEEIVLLNNRYYVEGYVNDTLVDKNEIFPISNTCFMSKRFAHIGFYRILFNEQNEVSGMHYNHGTWRLKSTKIR